MRLSIRGTPVPCQKIGREKDEPSVLLAILEHPQPFLDEADRFLLAIMLQTESRQFEIGVRRRHILCPQRDTPIKVAVAFGEMVQDSEQAIVLDRELIRPSGASRGLLPHSFGKTAIFSKSLLAEHLGVTLGGPVEYAVFVVHLACKKIASELHRLW